MLQVEALANRCAAFGVAVDDWLHRHEGAPTIQLGTRESGYIVVNLASGRFSGHFGGQEFSSDCAYGETCLPWFNAVRAFFADPSAPWPFAKDNP